VALPEEEAARILWLDAFVANVDRSWRNPNLLVWHGDVWLIDHGASLYFHHAWAGGLTAPDRFAVQEYDVTDHVLAAHAGAVPAVDAEMAGRLTDEVLDLAVAAVPEDWLVDRPAAPEQLRDAYAAFLRARRDSGRPWLPGRP
jgi:hypothetical protein